MHLPRVRAGQEVHDHKAQAGVDLYALAKGLLRVGDSEQAAAWLAAYASWCTTYDEFLREETTSDDGRTFLAHERLAKTRNSLTALVRQGTPSPTLIRTFNRLVVGDDLPAVGYAGCEEACGRSVHAGPRGGHSRERLDGACVSALLGDVAQHPQHAPPGRTARPRPSSP